MSAYKVLVVGGGAGGLAVSSALGRRLGKENVAVVDEALTHYYQALWTLVCDFFQLYPKKKLEWFGADGTSDRWEEGLRRLRNQESP